jgi:ribosomal subunit interface protein
MKSNLTSAAPFDRHAARKVKITTWNGEFMDILIRAKGVELNDKLLEAVNRKIGRVRQHAPRAMRARVQLQKLRANPSPRQFRAKVHYEIPGNDMFAEHTAHDPVAAIDLVAEKIERRLRRRKTARLSGRVRDARIRVRHWPATASA